VKVTDLNKHPVLDVSSATTVGQIDDVVVDPSTRHVLGFSLRKTPGKETWLPWDGLKALGADAATIEGTDAIVIGPDETAPPALTRGKVIGGRVLTDQGLSLGTLADIDVDPESGTVTELILTSGHVIPGDSLRGIGSYATVVVHPAG
jgi:sporulation protein YlmC with PRC-barrel domain